MTPKIIITKSDGRKVVFNPNKIYSTCRRAGASKETANKIIKKIKGQIHLGLDTRDIYKLVLHALSEEKGAKAIKQRYQLKESIMKLGPAGFAFENYVGELLEHYNFELTKLRGKIPGKCAKHEIDVIATSHGKKYMVECKYHSKRGYYTGLKESLYTHARFLDTAPFFDKEVLACNTKISTQAKKYAKCVGQNVISWKYPPGKSLEKIIEKNKLYPITILNLTRKELDIFFKNKIMIAKKILNYSDQQLARKTGINQKRIANLQNLASEILALR